VHERARVPRQLSALESIATRADAHSGRPVAVESPRQAIDSQGPGAAIRETHVSKHTNTSSPALRTGVAALVATLVLCLSGTATADTVTLKGRGTYFVHRALMPLGNGGAAVHVTNKTVMSVEPSETGVMFGECAGLAYLTPDAKYASRIYCNFTESAEDTLVVQGDVSPDGGKLAIIGGSGRWKDATGSGKIMPLGEDDEQGRYAYELQVVTP
jgi:hypothetical protein